MSNANLFYKDPQAVLDYQIDWSDWLGTDTITVSTWTVPTGLTKVSDTKTDTTTTIWLSGGTAGTYYTVVNHITTLNARQEDRELLILVGDSVYYCTLSEVKAALGETGTDHDVELMLAIAAATQVVDGYCHRTFTTSTSAARYFTAEYGDTVIIDDAQTISEVATDEAGDLTYSRVWATTDYVTRPANSSPKTNLRRASNGRYSFPTTRDAVKVTAVWGYGSPPAAVRKFCVNYAQRLFLRNDAPFGIMGGNLGGAAEIYIPANDPDVQNLLGPYVRADSRIGVY